VKRTLDESVRPGGGAVRAYQGFGACGEAHGKTQDEYLKH